MTYLIYDAIINLRYIDLNLNRSRSDCKEYKMRIQKVALALPSRKVSNEQILSQIKFGGELTNGAGDKVLRLLEKTLTVIGSHTRYWLEEGQTPESVTLDACRQALKTLEDGQTIDLLIYASVFSDVVEPAAANLIAHKLGLDGVEAFDMKAACDGWMKAMKMAGAYIRAGVHKRILIVNAEFSMVENFAIRPHLFKLNSKEELQWRMPIFTIGEGATATIVEGNPEDPAWEFTNVTRNELNVLCSVMARSFKPTTESSVRLAKDGPGWFTSWAAELSESGIPMAIEAFEKLNVPTGSVDHLFTHASGSKDWRYIARTLGLDNKIVDIHPLTGNLVSASVPAALAIAEQEGWLKRGRNIALLVASAGMTASAAHTTY